MVGIAFTGVYGAVCYYGTGHHHDIIRLGIAGSIANTVCETSFHLLDTLNIRMKAAKGESA